MAEISDMFRKFLLSQNHRLPKFLENIAMSAPEQVGAAEQSHPRTSSFNHEEEDAL